MIANNFLRAVHRKGRCTINNWLALLAFFSFLFLQLFYLFFVWFEYFFDVGVLVHRLDLCLVDVLYKLSLCLFAVIIDEDEVLRGEDLFFLDVPDGLLQIEQLGRAGFIRLLLCEEVPDLGLYLLQIVFDEIMAFLKGKKR